MPDVSVVFGLSVVLPLCSQKVLFWAGKAREHASTSHFDAARALVRTVSNMQQVAIRAAVAPVSLAGRRASVQTGVRLATARVRIARAVQWRARADSGQVRTVCAAILRFQCAC